jgi:hypothetical protein
LTKALSCGITLLSQISLSLKRGNVEAGEI